MDWSRCFEIGGLFVVVGRGRSLVEGNLYGQVLAWRPMEENWVLRDMVVLGLLEDLVVQRRRMVRLRYAVVELGSLVVMMAVVGMEILVMFRYSHQEKQERCYSPRPTGACEGYPPPP